MVTNLEDIGSQLIPMVLEEPVLLFQLRISDKQKAHHPEPRYRDRAGEIGILEADSPRGVGREKGESDSIDENRLARMHSAPFNSLFLRGGERKAVRLRPARERGIPVGTRPHRAEHGRRSADVIGVGVREDERLERAAASEHVGQNGAAAGVATAPRRPGIEQHPAAGVGAQQDRITLPHVQDVQLDVAAPAERDRREDRHCRRVPRLPQSPAATEIGSRTQRRAPPRQARPIAPSGAWS